MHTYVYMYTYSCSCIQVMYRCIHVYMYIYIYIWINRCVYMCIYILFSIGPGGQTPWFITCRAALVAISWLVRPAPDCKERT